MTVLSIQPARGKQQAATLAKQLAQFAGSRRGAAAAAVVLLAGGGYAYIQEQKQKARQRCASYRCTHTEIEPLQEPLHVRRVELRHTLTSATCRVRQDETSTSKQGRPKRSSPAALQGLVKYLLSIAGRRIFVLFLLSIARTALSNRLARLQVLLTIAC